MNQVVLGPEVTFERPLLPSELQEKAGLLSVVSLEYLSSDQGVTAEPEGGVLGHIANRAHWKQAAFHSQEVDREGMPPQQAGMHLQQAVSHLASLGVVEAVL